MSVLNIEKMLSYPRSVIRNTLAIDQCPHKGEYDANDSVCLECFDEDDCRWVQHTHEYSSFDQRSSQELIAEFDYARDYINAQVTFWGHHQSTCHCASCNWLREAQAYVEHQQFL